MSNQHVLGFFQPSWHSDKDGEATVIQPDGSEINAFVIQQDTLTKIDTCYRQLGLGGMKSVSPSDTVHKHQALLTEAIASKCTIAKFLRGQLKGDLDVAVAGLLPGVQWTNQFRNGKSIKPPPPLGNISVGTKVGKWGARSGCWKTGKISKLSVKTTIPFASTSQKTVPMPSSPTPAKHFKLELSGLIEVMGDDLNGTFQMQGDSGSALCTEDGSLIGILSSGGLGRLAYAIPIWTMIEAFDLSFPAKALAKQSMGKLD